MSSRRSTVNYAVSASRSPLTVDSDNAMDWRPDSVKTSSGLSAAQDVDCDIINGTDIEDEDGTSVETGSVYRKTTGRMFES